MDIEKIKAMFAAAIEVDKETGEAAVEELNRFLAAFDPPRCSCMYMEIEAGEGLEFFADPWCPIHKQYLFEYESK